MFERLTANWRSAVSHCVEESSEDSYATAWRHYLAMCSSLDCALRLPHPAYAAEAARQSITYDTMMILVFIAHLQSPADPPTTASRQPSPPTCRACDITGART